MTEPSYIIRANILRYQSILNGQDITDTTRQTVLALLAEAQINLRLAIEEEEQRQ